MLTILKEKILNNSLTVGLVGMGYVGLPLAGAFSKKFKTIGYDHDKKRITELKSNFDKNHSVNLKILKKIYFSKNLNDLKLCDVIIFTLPTPINKKNKPNLSILLNSIKKISITGIKNKLLIVESTIAPGDSEELIIPLIEQKSNLKINQDFYYGFSPERINPGDKKNNIYNITKIVSGSNKNITNIIYILYKKIIKNIIKTNTIKEAEMAKIIENCQRDINIGFINEISNICHLLNISTHKVLKLASTKWNFIKFKPGLVGGHCIGVDPYYLAEKSIKLGYNPKIILSGRNVNENFPYKIFKKIKKKLGTKIKKRILLMGITYKENCNDIRNSKAIKLYKIFKEKNFIIDIYDPLIEIKSLKKIKKPKKFQYDVIIIAVGHDIFKKMGYNKICQLGKKEFFIYDIQNIFPNKPRSIYL
jgi:UDP-N-acetyl-D-galactosamine dehydrogenase